ncbi:MAG: hypothetical protein LBB16_03205 [Puniceicoccales bacterium]|jgi:hypothetical protein|nr:hypothetical protein [Puniceicoccales bacterium]
MNLESKKLDQAAKVANVESTDTKKSKSSFAGRTFGTGAGNKTFKTREVMSATDNKKSIIETESSVDSAPQA